MGDDAGGGDEDGDGDWTWSQSLLVVGISDVFMEMGGELGGGSLVIVIVGVGFII